MEKRHLVFMTFYTVFGAVLIIFFLKGALLIGRYGITASSMQCEQGVDHNQTIAAETEVSHEYIFTVIVYAILSVMRILEYVLLAKQFHFFLFQQRVIDPSAFFQKHSKRFFYLLLFSVILLPYFLLGFAIPALGIYQEIEHSERQCYRHYHEIYITYCVINFLRYISAYTVRIMMIYTALSLNKIWFPDHAGPPRHTSVGLAKIVDNGDTVIENTGPGTCAQEGPEDSGSGPDNAESTESGPDNTEANDASTCDANAYVLQKVLNDWKLVSTDYQNRAKNYAAIGKQVQVIEELFQTWFIVPWVIYFVASSLKTYNILRPWNADGDGDTPPSDIPQLYYLLYNINQLFTLIVPFLCAKKINTYHQKYFKLMRDHQLKEFEDDPSRLSFARQLLVERESGYDFVPRIVGTSITISIGSPLFVILLLIGIFLSVSESIL